MGQTPQKQYENFLRHYDYAIKLFDENWAWEFLRRNEDFRREAFGALETSPKTNEEDCGVSIAFMPKPQPEAAKWGLIFFPDPRRSSLLADVYWSGDRFPRKLNVNVVPCSADTIDLLKEKSMQRCKVIHFTDEKGGEHLLLKGKRSAAQVNCKGLSLLSEEPVKMEVLIAGDSRPHAVASWLARIDSLLESDADEDQSWSPQNMRLRNSLVALDAHLAGLTLFQTAQILYGDDAATKAWSSRSRALKDKVRRFRQKGIKLRDEAYTELLA